MSLPTVDFMWHFALRLKSNAVSKLLSRCVCASHTLVNILGTLELGEALSFSKAQVLCFPAESALLKDLVGGKLIC